MNSLKKPKVKIILSCFALLTLVMYWKILTWATSSYVSTEDQFPAVISDQDANQVDYSNERANCRRVWSPSVTRWLGARMDRTKVPVWDRAHGKLHYQLNSWWVLQSPLARAVDAEVIFERLYQRGFPEGDAIEEMRRRSRDCFNCAIVGDSRELLSTGYGKQIDEHKIVIRLGADSIKGFEYYVGRKTTIRLVTPTDMIDKKDPGSLLMMAPYKPEDLTKFSEIIMKDAENDKESYDLSKTLIMHPGFIRYVYERWAQRHGNTISLKFLSVIFALHKCDSISLYGMWNEDSKSSATYWKEFDETKKERGRIDGQFDPEYEGQMIEQFEMKNIIKIHQ